MADRRTLIVHNAALHFLAQLIIYAGPLVALAGLIFGVPMLAFVGAALLLIGRLPLVTLQEKNLFASRREVEIEPNSREIMVDYKTALFTIDIENAYIFPRIDKSPTIRIYGKSKLMPALDIEAKDFDEAHETLQKIGFGADQKAATFRSLAPKLVMFVPLALCAPLLAFVPLIGHLNEPMPRFVMPLMAVLTGAAMRFVQIRRRVIVKPDGIETTTLGRFREWYPFAEVTKATRTLTNGVLESKTQKPLRLRGTAVSAELTGGQRSHDQLVERAMDAYDAYRTHHLLPSHETAQIAEQNEAALPSEVIRLRYNWLAWMLPAALYAIAIGGIFVLNHASHLQAGVGIGAGIAAFALQIYLSLNPHRFVREKVAALGDGLLIGKTKVDQARFENAYVQPVNTLTTGRIHRKEYRTLPRVMLVGKKWRDSISVFVNDEAEGRAILRALAIDPAHATSTFNVRAGFFSSPGVRVMLTMLPAMTTNWIIHLHGIFRVGLIALILLSWLNTFWPTKLKVGFDGVFIKSLRRSQFFPFSDITRVEPSTEGFAMFMMNGKRVEIRTSVGLQAGQSSEGIVRRIREGLDYAKKIGGGGALALARGDLPAREWIHRLRAIGKGESTGYRVAAVEPADLWRVVEDPSARAEERIAAAVALRVDEQAASRLRVAASVSASPKVRAALEAAADENEELLERAFDEEKEDDDATKASS